MFFIQQTILLGLPLILVPIIIHLINRQRFRRKQWAAMEFILRANRSAITQAKLRHFLILLFRTLAVLALILAVSRPLIGGWLGNTFSGAPDVVLMLLDRSASMETKVNAEGQSRRERALNLLADAARQFENKSRLVLIDSATKTAIDLASAETLAASPTVSATSTQADGPGLLESAFQWIVENQAGNTEIWIASDFQASNWNADDDRWKTIGERFDSLPQSFTFRTLSIGQADSPNLGTTLKEALVKVTGSGATLQVTSDVTASEFEEAQNYPVDVEIDESVSQSEIQLIASKMRWRQSMNLANTKTNGWGSILLPSDSNPADNQAFFVYQRGLSGKTFIVGNDPVETQICSLLLNAVAPDQDHLVMTTAGALNADWSDCQLAVWMGATPAGNVATQLRKFITEGGVCLFFPPSEPDNIPFLGSTWTQLGVMSNEAPMKISTWTESEGPLRVTAEGNSLPLGRIEAYEWMELTSGGETLASFVNEIPFLTRAIAAQGAAYWCATSVAPTQSNLADGLTLLPMMERLLNEAVMRSLPRSSFECGDPFLTQDNIEWRAVGRSNDLDPTLNAGVYTSGDRYIAVNVPASEIDPDRFNASLLSASLPSLSIRNWEDSAGAQANPTSEIWRFILFGMLAFLLAESFLILPNTTPAAVPASG